MWMIDNDETIVSHPDSFLIGHTLFSLQEHQGEGEEEEEKEIISEMLAGNSGDGCLVFDEFLDKKVIMAWRPVRIGESVWSICATSEYDCISTPVRIHSRNVNLGTELLMVQFILGGTWFYRSQREKAKLAIRAQSWWIRFHLST